MYYFLDMQTVLIDGGKLEYVVCECGQSVILGDTIMSMEDFCNVAGKKKKMV